MLRTAHLVWCLNIKYYYLLLWADQGSVSMTAITVSDSEVCSVPEEGAQVTGVLFGLDFPFRGALGFFSVSNMVPAFPEGFIHFDKYIPR